MKRTSVSPWTSEARRLRAQMTPETRRLWARLRGRRMCGLRFRREHPLGDYFADFYCHSIRLAIEVDGPVHSESPNVEYDRRRHAYFASIGVTVLRFDNDEIRIGLDAVLEKIRTVCLLQIDH